MKKFTLIEVMIVMVIIAILSAVALPKFTAYREQAQNESRKNYVSLVTTAKERYQLNYGVSVGTEVTFDCFNSIIVPQFSNLQGYLRN